MQKELPGEWVSLSLIDMDFLRAEIDTNLSNIRIRCRRQTSEEEYRRGLRVALRIALELKKELRKTLALVQA